MNNQLMENLVLGGFCYEVAFPFSKAREVSLEKVLARAGKVLNKKTLNQGQNSAIAEKCL